ncbi:cytochrome c maturation protein CcmE [Sorangium sp. So ce1097]|uniref:cytochrome c maturation protein CcmE n=1 Tax=Sorangium sp. So ce1097 TaxID=3133330 RepID=UPI003F5D6CFA
MSKKLDEELAQALSLVEQQETPAVVKPAAPSAQPKPRPSRSLGLLATLLVMVGALVALFLVGFKEAAVYATPVDQLLASKDKLAGRKVRVEGELVPGTLVKRDSPCEYRFQIHGTQAELPVRYAQCVIPDTFRDVPSGGVEVTVEGTLTQDGNFEATLVMAKCTSKYDPNSHEMNGGAKPGEGPLSLKN